MSVHCLCDPDLYNPQFVTHILYMFKPTVCPGMQHTAANQGMQGSLYNTIIIHVHVTILREYWVLIVLLLTVYVCGFYMYMYTCILLLCRILTIFVNACWSFRKVLFHAVTIVCIS